MDNQQFVKVAIKESADSAITHALAESRLLQRLSEEDRKLFALEIRACADRCLFGLFTLIDGVGSHDGVFEIVHVTGDDEQRTTLNPPNTEMLHDLFHEIRTKNN